MHNRLSIRRYSVSTGAYILCVRIDPRVNWKLGLAATTGCHKPPLWLSLFLLFFSLLFYFLFIAWESLSHYVTQGVTMSHQTVTSRSHGSAGK